MVLGHTPVCSTIDEGQSEQILMPAVMAPNRFQPAPERSHKITIVPAACLRGCVIINFEGKGLEYTTSGGNLGYLLQDGCRSEELPAHLALLERTHNVRLIVDRQAAGI